MPLDPQPLTADLLVEVEGSVLPAEIVRLLMLAFLEDNRSLPDAFELRFRDPDRVVVEKGRLAIGNRVRIGVTTGAQSSPTWLHTGEITALEAELDGRGSWTVVRGYDVTHRLQRGRAVCAYRQMSAGEIVRQVADRVGVAVGRIDPTPVLAEVIQANTSDWAFLAGLAGDLGMELSAEDGRLSLRTPAAAGSGPSVVLALGSNLIRFRAAVTAAEHVDEVHVRSWDPRTKQVLIGKGSAASTRSAEIAMQPRETTAAFAGSRTLTVTDAPYASEQRHVDAVAASLAEQVAAAFAELEAVVRGDPRIHSGGTLELTGIGKPFDGRFVVTSARHVFDAEDGYQTWLTVSGRQDRTLLGLVNGSLATGSTAQVAGLVPAIVTDTQDPDMLGRVKVRLPWLDDSLQTGWARTVQLGGKGGGGVIVPEVDDEVLVGFDQGRIERPFVLGGLYNGVDKPGEGDVAIVDASSGSVSRRSLASRSGNRLEILDAPNGANGVTLITGDGRLSITLDRKGAVIRISSGGKVEIAADGDISLKAGGSGRIEAAGNLTLKAGGSIVAEATTNVGLTAKASMSLTGRAKAQLTSSGQVSVSGTLAELKGSAATVITGTPVKIN